MSEIPDYFKSYRRHHEPPLVIETLETIVRHAIINSGETPLTHKRIYDAGCGAGGWLARFIRWGAQPEHLTGVDLTPERITLARESLPKGVTLRVGDASVSGLPDQSQDIVSQFVVISTILDPAVRQRLATEMLRVKKPDGVILWYDLRVNNPFNQHIRRVSEREIHTLFPGRDILLRSVTLEPHVGRFIAPRSPRAFRVLSHVPALRSHYLGIIR